MNVFIEGREFSVRGHLFRTARLRHEWCDFLHDIPRTVTELESQRVADLFTFVPDIGNPPTAYPCHRDRASIAVLPVTTHDAWWEAVGKKKRNQIRKAIKSGVEIRECRLDASYARGVERLYNECPVRQGRKFYHFGQTATEIEQELSSFVDRTILVGAYIGVQMVGFMKVFRADHALRIIHILALLSERDKCVMDALIDYAVKLCEKHHYGYLHYGTWTDNGIGAFRTKHGFQRMEVPRFYVPLDRRGRIMLHFNLHRPIRDRLPKGMMEPLLRARAKWNGIRFAGASSLNDA